ncbi:MAG: hypothetical protein A2X17_07115 [Bacteroidetes bacterium GWF2_41_61]|nr:MAG: hypothetical protein A2X17_07115 [Bacteroidetes bacterium GWF2_41_61]OFY90437.1 MAG: hypothetical protein A2266_01020 [Bacteroidetes bacterium RIFOXYA12_FULL_40_10]HBG23887.1 hypothetical protein [Rikenellaceae bacterium]
MKIVKRIVFGIIIAFFLSIIFSSIFPGRVKIVDKVRLFAQKPVIQWIGNIRLDNLPVVDSTKAIARVDIDFEELRQYLESIPPGSIFLTRTRSYAITEFIPGMWKHAGIFIGTKSRLAEKFGAQSNLFKMLDTLMSESEIYILDSEAAGVHVHPFRDMSNLREDSYLTNFTAFTLTGTIEQKRVFIEESLKFLSREYDYDWLTEDESAIYCSELIYHSLKKLGIEIKKRTTTLSREVITPDDLYNYMVKNSGKRENFVFRINICKENGRLKECQK